MALYIIALSNVLLTKKKINIHFWNPRDFSKDKHKKVDDIPYGGGGGMLMTCQPLFDCIESVKKQNSGKVIYMSAKGKVLDQKIAQEYSNNQKQLIILCGHYEGIDQRVIDRHVDQEVSIGEYVLTGGEVPAMVLIDSVTRLTKGVIQKHSHQNESFSPALAGKKEYPHYTRPENFRDFIVPKVLISGNHKKIEEWRKNNLE